MRCRKEKKRKEKKRKEKREWKEGRMKLMV
jgi:hypothetical protein